MGTFGKQDDRDTPPQAGAGAKHAEAIRHRIAEARERLRRAQDQGATSSGAVAGSRQGSRMAQKAAPATKTPIEIDPTKVPRPGWSSVCAPRVGHAPIPPHDISLSQSRRAQQPQKPNPADPRTPDVRRTDQASAVPHRPRGSAPAEGVRVAPPPPRTSLTSANLRGPRSPKGRTHGSSIFFRALCISTALHVAVFGGGAWMALTHPSGFGADYGSILKASLVSPDDAWARETVPPPIDVASIERWPASSGSATTKVTRPRGRYPRRSGASGAAENMKPVVSTGDLGRRAAPSGGSPTAAERTLSQQSTTSEASPAAPGLDAGQANSVSGLSAPPVLRETVGAALPIPSVEPPSPSIVTSDSSVARVWEATEMSPPAVETTPRQGQTEPVKANALKSFPAEAPMPTAALSSPPVLSQSVESLGLPSKPTGPVVIASVPRVASTPVTVTKISPEKPGIRLTEEQRVETAEVPRRTGAEATGEGTAGGQGGKVAGGQKEKAAEAQTNKGAETAAPVVPPVVSRFGPEVSRGSALPLAPKPREELPSATPVAESPSAMPGSSPLFQPDPAPPAPVESRPFARQPDPEGTLPPGPFQTARTTPIPPPPEEPPVTPKPLELPRPPSGPPGLSTTERVPELADEPTAPAKVEPPRPGMQPVEEQIGRTAEAQRAETAGVQGSRGAGENKNKLAEVQGGAGGEGRESKGMGEQGMKGDGEKRATKLAPVPVIPPVAEQPRAEVSRPPVPRPASQISEEVRIPTAVPESKRAASESAPDFQPESTPPSPVAERPTGKLAPAPPVSQVASPPTPSAEKSGATPSSMTPKLPPAGPAKPAAGSAPPAPPTVEPKPSPAAPQPRLVARTGAQAEPVVGAELGRGSQEDGMQRGTGAEASKMNMADGRGIPGAGRQRRAAAGAEGLKDNGEIASRSAGPGTAPSAWAKGEGRSAAAGMGGQGAKEQGAGESSQLQGAGLAGAADGSLVQSGPAPSPGSSTSGSGAGITDGRPAPGPSGGAPLALPPAPAVTPSQASPPPIIGLSGFSVQIHRPQGGTTSQAIQPLAGRVSGGAVKGIVVHLNGRQQLLDAWDNAFEGEVILRRGSNQIRVVAMGARGPLAEQSVEVQYVPPPSSAIRITRPADGTVFTAPAQDVIEVEGEVSDAGIRQARVIFNEFTIPVTVKDGHFSALIPAIAPEMTIWADARGEGGSHSSDPVTVRREPYKAVRAYVLLYLPTASRKIDARLWLSQRASTADTDSPRKITSHVPFGLPATEHTSALFALPAIQDGAYTLALDYRIPSGESVEKGWCSVIVPGTTGYRNLRLGPFRLTGKGRVVLAKFLRPYGIFWDEDYWFTAVAEGAGSFTKFRHTDGVSWVELKGEPEFPGAK